MLVRFPTIFYCDLKFCIQIAFKDISVRNYTYIIKYKNV